MLSNKVWLYNHIDEEKVKKVSCEAGIPGLLAKIFLSRGISDISYIKKFLSPSMDDFHDPFLLKDMDRAVERIIKAIKVKESIVVYGDYDVDGVTGTSVLYDFLLKQNANVKFYIPDRIEEGYGLSMSAVQRIKEQDTSLVITTDCGITAIEEVEYLTSGNIDAIITDHHECKESLPGAYAIVNPCRPDCTYPFKELAGVGVAYKLVEAICTKMGLGSLHLHYLDLVALGTVADVVPLVGENRIIVKHGISRLENTSNPGLRTLIDNSGLKDKPITSWSIGFVMAPRINAAGRIGDAGRAVRLFTTADAPEALEIVLKLNEENKFRQDTEAEIFKQAVNSIECDEAHKKNKILVVSGEGWHHGIIGIVASKITERYYKPCILISCEDGVGKGSGRSIQGFDLFHALGHCDSLLEKYGGHELAAGLSLKTDDINAFRELINTYAEAVLTEQDLIPKIKIDVDLSREDISIDNIRKMDMLAPFGAGNPGAVFAYSNFKIAETRTVGENKHLKLKLKDGGGYIDAIGFNMGSAASSLSSVDMFDAACSLEINAWNSVEKVQLNLKDIRLSEEFERRNRYFYSLDKCIASTSQDEFKNTKIECDIDSQCKIQNIEKYILDCLENGKRIAILVNTLESISVLEEMLRKSIINIKKPYKLCYTNFEGKNIETVCVIANPDMEIELERFDEVVFWGYWIDKAYLNRLKNKAKCDKILIYGNKKGSSFNIDEIIPDRQDLAVIYRLIKAKCDNSLLIEDLFVFARDMAYSNKINMNYFKVKKCMEIFEELNLIKKEPVGQFGMSVTMANKGGGKTNLESSALFRRLQGLKASYLED